ncbi:hypothetical protein OIU74_024205 [Salix koriyanagi]|uniref:Uncharacterized protein n=1 Tax=Salix koriyanagi TaxID=2511006 RepID=A0A9Q0W6M4_9ROSI|nr:hypothetical protein OIU74_024205 [Salix koriyanagi]
MAFSTNHLAIPLPQTTERATPLSTMADYETHHQHHQQQIPKETAFQAINTIIQLHFEKTLEKKRAIDLQKKELHKLFLLFFIFLSLIFMAEAQPNRLQCRHCWAPIILLSLITPHLLCLRGSNPQVHQWIQVPKKVSQAHSWPGY